MLAPIGPPAAEASKPGEAYWSTVTIEIAPSAVGELTKPVYPAAALAARAGECIAFVTVTIDSRGLVTDVAPTWQRLNIPSRFSEEFLDAARTAVRSWRFEPARFVYWKKTGSEDLQYIGTEAIPVRTDVKFTFEESGGVR
jgi:outer membrane biosynthesis protein TonB